MASRTTRCRGGGIGTFVAIGLALLCVSGPAGTVGAIEPGKPAAAMGGRSGPVLPVADVTPVAPPGEPVPLIDPADASGVPPAPLTVQPAAGGETAPGAGGAVIGNGELPPSGPERLVDPVLSIDPTLEGIAATRPIRRGLAGLLGKASVQPRSSDLWPVEAPILEALVGPSGATLGAPKGPVDPLWAARARPPVDLGEPAKTGGPVEAINPTLARAGTGAPRLR
jgi:hypothetical protein